MKKQINRTQPAGFMLMEVLLAFAIFSIAVTSIVIALNRTAELSQTMTQELDSTRTLRNLMTQTLTTPVPESEFVRDEVVEINDHTRARIQVTEFEATDADEHILPRLYKIRITLEDSLSSEQTTNELETIHYYPLTQ
ncbi:hypothetical protein SAMN02745181_1335 [Rubritalea squalenifaciens DSM 18772]|uniref:Prepilin-type N-terminal cleavage/methylation domain-containing protein n=1 Tax=Rubritalea squalenifaciens DSM 18772 TaxID=1123071 RepID=A0A1M6H1B7_9BACT|nr:hypothetical protein [Rubritalea squalenifaciens]SHJ16040.1 hypothetical protein SAMN02745181_1335 [Rubritalea squalenifaciens DSM 18772]